MLNLRLETAPRAASRVIDLLATFGITAPAELHTALAVHKQLTLPAVDPGDPAPLLTGVTPAQAIKALDKWFEEVARFDVRKNHAGQVNNATSRGVLRALTNCRDGILEACRAPFTDHAGVFSEHFRELPAGRWADTASIFTAGSTAVAHYEAALEAARHLDVLADIRRDLTAGDPVGFVGLATEYADWPAGVDVESFGAAIHGTPPTPLGRWAATLAQHPEARLVWRSIDEHKNAIKHVTAWRTELERHHMGAGIHGIQPTRRAVTG